MGDWQGAAGGVVAMEPMCNVRGHIHAQGKK